VNRGPARSANPLSTLEPVDWRLIPAAVVLWLAGLLGLLVAWWCAVVCGVLGCLAGVAAFRRARTRRDPDARWRSQGVAWSLLICGVLAVVPVGLRIQEASQDPLRGQAARGVQVRLRMIVEERPRPVFSAGFGGEQAGVRSVVVPVEVDAGKSLEGPADLGPSVGAEILVVAPAADWSALLPGQQIVADGSLGPADPGRLAVAVLRVRGPPNWTGEAPSWQRAAESVRTGLRQAAAGTLAEEPAGLLPAIVVGDTSALPHRVVDEFKVAGMSHLLAVSGANLAIVCLAVLLLVRALRLGPRVAATASMLALLGFVLLAGPEPSVLRAATMGGVGLLAVALGRADAAMPALAVAVIGLVAHDPDLAVNVGFALSVVATAALVLLAPRWSAAIGRYGVPRGLAEALAVPAAAHVATAPIVAGMAGQVSLVAVAANLVAAPVVAPATVLGLVAALLAGPARWLAELLVTVAGPLVSWLIIVGRQASQVPSAAVAWPSGWWGGLLLLAVIAVGWLGLRNARLRVLVVAVLAGVVIAVVPIRVLAPAWPPAGWSAVACDVGQGDATVLATAEPDRAVLVDTGPDPRPVVECLNRLGVTGLPLVVLSHLHADHIGGLSAVLADWPVGAVAVGSARLPEWAWRQVRSDADRAGVPVVWLSAGQQLEWPGLTLEVLGPSHVDPRDSGEVTGTEINNGSVVLRAGTRSGRILLTGDVEFAAQTDLLASTVDLSAEVLKVPHHGSRFTTPEFLAAVAARVAMISVGTGNRYGHPSPLTVGRLAGEGALVTRTDLDGDCAILPGDRGPQVVRRGDPRAPPR
jgi:competence protein ComEC